jgi:hypothetical protein
MKSTVTYDQNMKIYCLSVLTQGMDGKLNHPNPLGV